VKSRFRQSLAILLILGPSSALGRQQATETPGDTLAIVGRSIVTSDELAERIDLMPWAGKNKLAELDSVKVNALNSLVAEKLLAQEGMEKRLDRDPSVRAMEHSLERLLARDELYRREVLDKISVNPGEISRGIERYARLLRVRVMIAGSESDANVLRNEVQNAAGNESLSGRDTLGLFVSQDTIEVRLGSLDQALENSAYSLHMGEVSQPVHEEGHGWMLVQLIDWKTNPDYVEQSVPARRLAVEKILRTRKRDVRALEYVRATLSSQSARVEFGTLKVLSDALRKLVVQDSARRRVGDHYRSLPTDIDGLRNSLHEKMDSLLVRMSGEKLTVGQAIEGLRYEPFLFRSLRPNDFLVETNQMLKKIVENELLAREAFRKHLQNTRTVQRDLALWSNYWAANAAVGLAIDTISTTPDEVASSVMKADSLLGKLNEVNIREIFSDSIRSLLELAIRIRAGESMEKLAAQYSKRQEWRTRKGESGLFPISDHPAIGLAALAADTGILVGPLETEGGYSLFQTLGKRITSRARVVFDSLVIDTRNEILEKKRTYVLDKYVAELASKFGVEIRYNALKALKINPFQMVTKRMIGFGGVIPAVPPLGPLSGWTKEHEDVQGVFP
jgi:parvulin-like peptidyl-prolyl isomerase